MRPRLLEILRCPECRGELRLQGGAAGEEITTGTLVCASAREFPIVRGIPRFVSSSNYASNFGFQWNQFRSTQLDSSSGLSISRDRFVRETRWGSAEMSGKLVLDAGCGAGRFAEIALSFGAELVAIDYSDAVDAAYENLRQSTSVHVVQADIYKLPFALETFDLVYSLGVLQHTPDPWAAVSALVAQVKRGGSIAIDFYLRRWLNAFEPKYILRPITRRIDARRLFAFLQRTVPSLLAVSRFVSRIPIAGRYAARLVPVANYGGVYPLNERQLSDWALLDTFDWFAPRYDQPQTAERLRRELIAAGLEQVEVFRADHLTGKGQKPR